MLIFWYTMCENHLACSFWCCFYLSLFCSINFFFGAHLSSHSFLNPKNRITYVLHLFDRFLSLALSLNCSVMLSRNILVFELDVDFLFDLKHKQFNRVNTSILWLVFIFIKSWVLFNFGSTIQFPLLRLSIAFNINSFYSLFSPSLFSFVKQTKLVRRHKPYK